MKAMNVHQMAASLFLGSAVFFGLMCVLLIGFFNSGGASKEIGFLASIIGVVTFLVGSVAAAMLARIRRYPFDGASADGQAVLATAFAALTAVMTIAAFADEPDVMLILVIGLLFVGLGGSLIGSTMISIAWLRTGGRRRNVAAAFLAAIVLAIVGAAAPIAAILGVAVGLGAWVAAALVAIDASRSSTVP